MSLVNRGRALLYDRPKGRLPLTTYAGYGVGQIGGQIMRDTPALLLPFFMTSILGLEAFLMSYVILIPKIWVFFANPLTGILSDRTNTPWGRRRPFLWSADLSAPFPSIFCLTCRPFRRRFGLRLI